MNARRLLAVAIPLVSVMFCAACSQDRTDSKPQAIFLDKSQIKKAEPKVELFEINGIKAPADASQFAAYVKDLNAKVKITSRSTMLVPYQDIILYSSAWCQADWN